MSEISQPTFSKNWEDRMNAKDNAAAPPIDSLLRYLKIGHSPHWYDDSTRWHAALTALVAERDALRKNTTELESELTAYAQRVSDLIAEKWRLQDRIKELEAHPPAASDLRERDETLIRWMDQVTAMLCHSMTHSHDAKQELVTRCDAAIAAMRKGDTNAK